MLRPNRQSTIGDRPSAFTLVEMVVVVAIIVIILGFALPAASSLWNERKNADAVNTIQGLLVTARARALGSDGVERGFLAFVDESGTQRFVFLEQDRTRLADPAWEHVFVVTDDPTLSLPPPMRVVPRYVVDDPTVSGVAPVTFSDEELADNDFAALPASADQGQRHRNFFTMIFSSDGQLLVGRDVLIQDPPGVIGVSAAGDLVGGRTGLPIGPGDPDPPTTSKYYVGPAQDTAPIGQTIAFLVRDDDTNDTALNFPSVDGLLVYDDDSFNATADPSDKRELLLDTARPFYVSRLTGTVIRGPVGENQTP